MKNCLALNSYIGLVRSSVIASGFIFELPIGLNDVSHKALDFDVCFSLTQFDDQGVEEYISKQDIKFGTNPNPGVLPFELSFTSKLTGVLNFFDTYSVIPRFLLFKKMYFTSQIRLISLEW